MSPRAGPSPSLLLLLALVILGALVGIPLQLGPAAPTGPRTGLVVDARGYGAGHTSVYHFDADGQLVERVLTDPQGRFALQAPTTVAHVLVRPDAGQGLVPRWRLDEPLGSGRMDFVLAPAHPLAVLVRDRSGAAVTGAEVRVYERGPPAAVLTLALTDSEGRATLVAPPRADVAVRVRGAPERWAWRLDVAARDSGPRHLEIDLGDERVVHGVLHGADAPTAGAWVLAGDPDDPEDLGFTRSASDGRFAVAVADARRTEVLVVDPEHRYLPRRLLLTGPESLDVTLEHGEPLQVSYVSPARDPRAWIWAWDSEEQAWSWGVPTAPDGRANLRVGRRFGIHAQATSPAYEGLTLWDLEYRSPFLQLSAERAQRP